IVSNASDDLPEPERPVITVNLSRGMSTSMFLRLCWRAPRTVMRSIAIRLEAVRLSPQRRILSGAEPYILTATSEAGKARPGPRSEFNVYVADCQRKLKLEL